MIHGLRNGTRSNSNVSKALQQRSSSIVKDNFGPGTQQTLVSIKRSKMHRTANTINSQVDASAEMNSGRDLKKFVSPSAF